MFFFELDGYTRDLNVLTNSFPTRRSADLPSIGARRAPTRSRMPLPFAISFTAMWARTTPASELRSAMAIAGSPSAAAPITSSSGCEPARRKEKLLVRSEEHTSELQSLMRLSYAVFCLKKKNQQTQQ